MSMSLKNQALYLTLTCFGTHYCLGNNAPLSSHKIADPIEEIFTHIYKTNRWLSSETVSGQGSELRVTHGMRNELSSLIKRFNITSIADAPCGDLNWMKYVDLGDCNYTGIDIVQEIIEKNTQQFGPTKKFKYLNLLENIIEKVDLIICRDLLAHFTYEQIFTVLKKFKQSGSKYILVTTNLRVENNCDMETTGDCRFLNLELPPFNFPRPLALIEEDVPCESERGKYLALWFLDDLKI